MSNCGFDFAKKYSVPLSDALAELKEGTTLRVIEFKAQYVLQQQNRINEMLTKSINQEKSKLKAIQAAQKKLESAEEGYKVWTVKQLQIELKSRGLKQTGNKDDYVERLTYHDLNGRPPAVTITKAKATKATNATKATKANESFFKPCASTSALPSPFTIHDFPEYTHIDPELDDETMRSLMAAVFQIISSTTITDADVEGLKDDTRTSRMLCKLVTRMRQMQWNREDEAEGVEEIDDYIYKIREVHHGRPIFNSLNQNSDVSFARLIDQRGYEESLAIALKLNMDLNTIRRFIADTISGNYRCGVDQQQVEQEDDDDNVSFNLYCTSDDDSEEEAEAEEAEAEEAEAEEAEAEEAEAEEAEAEEAEAEEAEAEEAEAEDAEAEEAEAEDAEAEANDPTIDYECTSNEWSREGDDDVNLDVANVFTNKLNYEDGTVMEEEETDTVLEEKTDTVLEEKTFTVLEEKTFTVLEETEEKKQPTEVNNYMYTSSDSEEEEEVVENVDLELHTTKRKRSDKKTKSNKRAAKLKRIILKEVMQMMMPMMMPYGAMPMMMPYGAMPMMQQQQAPMMMPMVQQQQQAPMMMPMVQQQQQAPMMMPMVQQYAPMMQMMQMMQQQGSMN
jgi:hypothetical protein